MELIIGNKNYSSWSMRPWLVMKHFEIPFEEKLIPLFRPETKERILAYSPAGKVPILRDGPRLVWESLAIGEYLAECFPKKNLWPRDKNQRAMARSVSQEMHAGFAHVRSEMPMNIHRKPSAIPLTEAAQVETRRILQIWRQNREHSQKGGPFLFGDFSIADAMFAPVAFRFDRYGVELDSPAREYMRAIFSVPAVQEWEDAARQEPWIIAENEK